MLPWLLIVVVLGVLVVWRCGVRFGQLGRRKRMLSPTDRILVLTAHPDDESMFFGPFILAAVRKWRAEVFLFCCSTGNHEGKGKIRQGELREACEILGIPSHNIRCLDDRDLPDNPKCKWSSGKLGNIILEHIQDWNPTVIVTFDANGVSGHKNHCDLSEAVISIQKDGLLPQGVRVLLLESVHFIRKYSKYLDVMMTIHTEFDLIALVRREDEAVISKAMSAHKSQMLWFRWLYISFSRYMLLNTFKEVFAKSHKPDPGLRSTKP